MKVLEDSLDGALKYSFKLLGYRDRSRKEIHDKLVQKGISEKVASGAVAYLEERGYIDDRKLAELLKKDAIERRHLGRKGVRGYLVKRGIEAEVVDSVSGTGSGGEDDYFESAQRLVEKKLRHMQGLDAREARKKLWGMLGRRGFSPEHIRKVLKSLDLKEESE